MVETPGRAARYQADMRAWKLWLGLLGHFGLATILLHTSNCILETIMQDSTQVISSN